MLRMLWVEENTVTVAELDISALGRPAAGGGWFWLDALNATPDEIEAIGHAMGFDPLSVDDVLSATEFPKAVDYGDHAFIVTHGPGVSADRLTTVEVDIFLGPGFLITLHREEVPGIEWTMERMATNQSDWRPARAMADVLEFAALRYLQLVDALDGEIEQLEDIAIAGDPAVLGQVQALRRDAILLRRVLAPERDMIRSLSRMEGILDNRERRSLEGHHDDYFRVVESLDAARSLLAAVLDTYRGTVAERMNEVMKVLTVFAAIVLPLSLMAGIYGMNFANMPELSWDWGYFALLGVMSATGIGLWLYFARRGFIGGPRIPRVDRALGRGLAAFVHLSLVPVREVMRILPDDRDR